MLVKEASTFVLDMSNSVRDWDDKLPTGNIPLNSFVPKYRPPVHAIEDIS